MRLVLCILLLASLCACAEAVHGPRLVTYTADRFYFRHLPWRDSRSSIDELASARCEQVGKQAALESAEQFAALDIRYATYFCIPTDIEEMDSLGTARDGPTFVSDRAQGK